MGDGFLWEDSGENSLDVFEIELLYGSYISNNCHKPQEQQQKELEIIYLWANKVVFDSVVLERIMMGEIDVSVKDGDVSFSGACGTCDIPDCPSRLNSAKNMIEKAYENEETEE